MVSKNKTKKEKEKRKLLTKFIIETGSRSFPGERQAIADLSLSTVVCVSSGAWQMDILCSNGKRYLNFISFDESRTKKVEKKEKN